MRCPFKLHPLGSSFQIVYELLGKPTTRIVSLSRLQVGQPRVHDEIVREYVSKRRLEAIQVAELPRNVFLVIDGHHRAAAAKRLGRRGIRAHVWKTKKRHAG